MQNIAPLISVITPVNDDRPNFDGYFEGWFKQSVSFSLFEVIVVTTNKIQFELVQKSLLKFSSPTNKELKISIILLEGIGKSRAKAMNHGIKASNGNLIYLFGDDFIPKANSIREHINFHNENKEIYCVGIGMAFLPNEFRNEFTDWLESSGSLFGVPFTYDTTSIPPDYFYIANTSIKKEFLKESGLFDEDFKYHTTEDWELGIRLKKLGLRSKLIREANVIHQHEVTLEGRLTAVRELGLSSKQYEIKNKNCQHPWCKDVNKYFLFLKLKMSLFKFLYKITKSKKMLHKQFKYQIKMAFHEGYHSKDNLLMKANQY